jgi:hypothetical protein
MLFLAQQAKLWVRFGIVTLQLQDQTLNSFNCTTLQFLQEVKPHHEYEGFLSFKEEEDINEQR